MNQGCWDRKKFEIAPKKALPIIGLESTWGAVVDSVDSKTDEKIDVKGRKLQTVKFDIRPSRAVGVNPETEINDWAALVGKSATLYIAGRRFGPQYLMLESVSQSGTVLDNYGRVIEATLSLGFLEDRGGKRTKAKPMYGGQVQKLPDSVVKALTASASDKSNKK